MLTYADIAGQFIGHKDLNEERRANIRDVLLPAVNALEEMARADGVVFKINPATGTHVSGKTFGGFRPQDCPQGAPNSSHKEGLGVDIYDPDGDIDAWCMAHLHLLEQCGIFIEHPSKTVGWSHWTTRAPRSRSRVFMP